VSACGTTGASSLSSWLAREADSTFDGSERMLLVPEGVFKPLLELSSAVVVHADSLLALVSDLILLLLFGS
jgi:hypothetical protein